jgi:ABC-2 type transport system ATP-binding protein
VAEAAIEIRGLRKSYGDVEAVRGIDLNVPEGGVFALLGPNGAGKTTTVEILEGYRTRDAGEARVLGQDPAKAERSLKQRVGIVLQTPGVEPYLTVAETIEMYRGYYQHPRPVDEIVELVGLTQKRDARVRKLSGGQQRRLDVAVALAGDPELLFLDEPTTGFDPAARRNAWEVVKNLGELGKTIFLTTHYMDEAQYLAREVAIIAGGVIVAQGPPESLGGRDTAATRIRFTLPEGHSLPDNLQRIAIVEGASVLLRTEDPVRTLHDLTSWAAGRRLRLDDIDVTRPSLEDVYLEIVGGEAGTEE